MKLAKSFITLWFAFSVFNNVYAIDVVYPGHERDDYFVSVLRHALSNKYNSENYHVKAYGLDMPKGRAFDLMASNKGMDVMFGGSTLERESKYMPIRFPLLKGLNGWRIPLVNKDNQSLFENITDVEKLNTVSAGLFHTWSDTRILQSNNLLVITGSDAEGLYYMLHKDRFDYFPRSVLEVIWDYKEHEHLNITIDKHALIHYPTAYYFYVRNGNYKLAQAISKGLELSFKDGSLESLFNEFYGDVVSRVKNEKRHVIKLRNPFLSKETPLARKELWVDLTAQ
ncbi:hypothetical protein HII17_14420 [Thalassotalea sp. M1531]|uniref:Solute-binding protein family 3/N-terminal domain-containing protein n=1 Tax=Thalassotalea algicola TaxID=2716224 RepID=A0A7Y0LEH9_9GAMM|nr:hypothetical protein [Thalassotalea algicola]NMP32752.1 hypothetical protein [Thalassotalea algicola]